MKKFNVGDQFTIVGQPERTVVDVEEFDDGTADLHFEYVWFDPIGGMHVTRCGVVQESELLRFELASVVYVPRREGEIRS